MKGPEVLGYQSCQSIFVRARRPDLLSQPSYFEGPSSAGLTDSGSAGLAGSAGLVGSAFLITIVSSLVVGNMLLPIDFLHL